MIELSLQSSTRATLAPRISLDVPTSGAPEHPTPRKVACALPFYVDNPDASARVHLGACALGRVCTRARDTARRHAPPQIYTTCANEQHMHLRTRSLKTIGRAAFEGNVKLQKLCLPESLDTVDEKAFEGCPLEKLSVEPGAEFDCYCENLARKLRLLDGVSVTGDGDPYRVRAGPHDVVFAPSHGSKNDGMM